MSKYKINKRCQNWIKSGRGTGTGIKYSPWLTISDLSSTGRSHRIWGSKTHRTHHLLSDLELATFLILDWNQSTKDIREQFPLNVEDTFKISQNTGIRHPQIRGDLTVMSTDFLVDTDLQVCPRVAIQVKASSDLLKPRTIEKLELERRYWLQKDIPWYLITEKQLPSTIFKNLNWLYSKKLVTEDIEESLRSLPFYKSFFLKHPNLKISEASMEIDNSYNLEPGESLYRIRSLMAIRAFQFDIYIPWLNITLNELHESPDLQSLGEHYA